MVRDYKELLIKYDLDSPLYLMDAKLSKSQWRVRVAKAVNSYWIGRLTSEATLYSTLKNMNYTLLYSWEMSSIVIQPVWRCA